MFINRGDSGEQFFYRYLGRLDNGVHVLHILDKSAGTGIFQSVIFVRFHIGSGFNRDGIIASQRLYMSVVRVYPLVGPKTPDIEIKGNEVEIRNGAGAISLRFDKQAN